MNDTSVSVDRYGVMGYPVTHSRSPLIHRLFALQTDQDIQYELLQVTPEKLEMATAGDAASGETFAIVHLDRAYALRTERSETSLSDLGTTVTLIGRYKY